MSGRLLAERIKHERELRAIFDGHERELRKQVEQAVEKQHDAEQVELRRRLDDLNHARERADAREAHTVNREVYDTQHVALKDQVDKLVTQLGVWRGIVVFLGVPGVVALLWTILAAFNGQTVTGPDGFIP